MQAKNKIYSTSAIFVLLFTSLIVFLIYPSFSYIKKSSADILSNREKTAFIYMQNQELDRFKKSFKDHEANLNQIEKLFIDRNNPVDFIKFLEKTSFDLNIIVDINLISGEKKEAAGNSPFSSFQISTKGNFQDILKFSEKLEKGPYLLQINSLSINKLTPGPEEEKNSPNMVGASFLVQVTNIEQTL